MSQGSEERGPLDPFLAPKFQPRGAPSIRSPPPPPEPMLGAGPPNADVGREGALFSTPLFLLRLLHTVTPNLGRLRNELLGS